MAALCAVAMTSFSVLPAAAKCTSQGCSGQSGGKNWNGNGQSNNGNWNGGGKKGHGQAKNGNWNGGGKKGHGQANNGKWNGNGKKGHGHNGYGYNKHGYHGGNDNAAIGLGIGLGLLGAAIATQPAPEVYYEEPRPRRCWNERRHGQYVRVCNY